jgi:hypothetical protein
MVGSFKRGETFSAGLNNFKAMVGANIKSVDVTKRLITSIILCNCTENFILFLMLLNSVIYPSVSSAVYFIFAMILTMMSMQRNEKTVNTKFIIAILLLVIAFG